APPLHWDFRTSVRLPAEHCHGGTSRDFRTYVRTISACQKLTPDPLVIWRDGNDTGGSAPITALHTTTGSRPRHHPALSPTRHPIRCRWTLRRSPWPKRP